MFTFPENETINSWLNQYIPNSANTNIYFLGDNCLLDTPVFNSAELINMFTSYQVITDTFNHSGYISTNAYGYHVFEKPFGQSPFLTMDPDYETTYFRPTEYFYQGNNIITLKSGNYVQILSFSYPVSDNWQDGYYVVLRWVNIRVENYYLNDVSVQKPTQDDVEITFNNSNKEISINLKDSLNLEDKNYAVYDISGKLIMKGKIASHHTIMSMPNVSSGVYLVRVNGKDINATRKVSFVK